MLGMRHLIISCYGYGLFMTQSPYMQNYKPGIRMISGHWKRHVSLVMAKVAENCLVKQAHINPPLGDPSAYGAAVS
jgi:hypothetical protein